MTYSAKLVRGSYTFDLNDGKYSLGQDFAPPGVLETAFLSGGTSANRSGGADLVGTRAENRSWSFTVRCLGSVSAETHNLVSRLVSFLAGATDTRQDKTYFEFRPDADLPEPIWGTFGQALRYEVVHATTALDDLYGRGRINRNAILVMVNLTIKPYAQGRPIQAAVATGGIAEDRIGTVDGSSRGLVVERATTNFVKNPVFGHATPLNGWTATTVSASVDYRNRLFGNPSVLLSGAAGTFRSVAAVTTATGNHVLSCYAKRIDGQPITNTDLALSFNNVLQATVYQAIGDGWYRLTVVKNLTGVAAYPFGVDTISNGVAAYIAGFQLEVGDFPTAVCWGDMLGCSWSGTAHDSSSSRIKGAVILGSPALSAKPINAQGTIRISLIFNGSICHCFSKSTGTAFRAYVDSGFIFFENGAVVFNQAIAPTLNRGDRVTLHFSWTRTKIEAYLNGVLKKSLNGAVANIVNSLHIGSHYVSVADGFTITDFAIFDQDLTGPQIAADYARIAPLAAADVNIGRIPWIYTKEMVSNVNRVRNALDTNNSNFAVVGGVPGSAECETEMILNPQMSFDLGDNILISNLNGREFINPSLLYFDINTTVDANRSGGGYGSQSIASPNYIFDNFKITVSPFVMEALVGKNIYLMVNMDDAGSGLEVKSRFYTGTGIVGIADFSYTSDPKTFVDTADFQFFLSNPLFLSSKNFYAYATQPGGVFTLGFKRAAGTADVKLDFFEILSEKVVLVTSGGNGIGEVVINGMHANIYDINTELSYHSMAVIGSGLDVMPDQYNVLSFFFYPSGAIAGPTRDILRFILTPRWHLL